MTTPTNPQSQDHDWERDQDNNQSLMDSLRSAGEAWLTAGSALGGVVSHFTRSFRDDRTAQEPQGAHALGDVADAHDTLGEQLKAAVDNARASFSSADNDRDFRAAASSFAADAEGIFRDLAGSVARAGDATVNSARADEAKGALRDAVAEVSDAFNAAVAGVRNRDGEPGIDAEGAVNDLRARLDGFIAKVTDQVSGSGTQDDIVDGEVVAEDTPGTGTGRDAR